MSLEDKIKELEEKIRFLTYPKCDCPGPGHSADCMVTVAACYEAAKEQNRKLLAGECIGKEPCDEWSPFSDRFYCSAACQQRALLAYISGSRDNWMAESRELRARLSETEAMTRELIGDTAVVLEPLNMNSYKEFSPEMTHAIGAAVESLRSVTEKFNKTRGPSAPSLDPVDTFDLESRVETLRYKLKKAVDHLKVITDGTLSMRVIKDIREFIDDLESHR